jgi:hypothetical protein
LSLAVLAAVFSAPLPAVAADLYAPGKDDRPAGRPGVYFRQSFPCDDPVQHLSLSAAERDTLTGTTSGQSTVDAYGCRPGWPQTGPEDLYILTVTQDLILDAWLADNTPDHDLILLSACHTDSCLAQANSELSATLRTGRSYYLIVDGYQEAHGEYSLTLETRHPGLAQEICAPGGAVPIDLAAGVTEELDGNLYGAPNLVSIDECSQLTWPGGEIWYALTLPPADTSSQQGGPVFHVRIDITAATSIQSLDLALWLFDGCGPDAACLGFADQGNAGQNETLSWQNMEPEPVTVYLAVDCRRSPAAELYGHFSLALGAAVSAERRSLSGVRDLFR